MTAFFLAVVFLDSWFDGSLTNSAVDKPVQATFLYLLVALLIIISQIEFSRLAAAKNIRIFTLFSITASIAFAGTWYLQQFIEASSATYLAFLSVFVLGGLFLYQHICYGISGVIANCGANYFSIIYLGLLSTFVLAIRIDFGLWALLMFVFVVKFADIGAYTVGRLFGKHKFSPRISPGKTWEGMIGAVIAAIIVAFCFAATCGIMNKLLAIVFGFCFAFVGQFGDLAESMIKRDAEQKDSSNSVPGFGGILDVIDSPLAAAPFAYLFFTFCC